jgi:parvulin-like peptidyl-prolyl isomerase
MLEKLLDRFREKGPSRPHSKAETEKRRRLVIVLLIVVAVVSSVSVVGYGYYNTSIRPWHQRILKVNGTVIEMRAFVYALRLQQSYSSYYSSEAEWAQSVASGMEQNELMRQALENDFGVDVASVVSDEAIEAYLRPIFVSNGTISDNATEDEYQQVYKESLAGWEKTYRVSAKYFIDLALEPALISDELQKQIGDRDYPAADNYEHAQVQALLITGADDATQLRARWEAGETFDTLAEEDAVSESIKDTASDNTTVEWVAKGIKSTAFDDFVFSATPGVLSDPIQDSDNTGSYWLIMVVAREPRTLSESDRETLVSEAYSKWLEEAMNSEDNDIVSYLEKKGGAAKLSWALDHVTVSTN